MLEELRAKIKKAFGEEQAARVRVAYEFAEKAHDGQKRSSGEPYSIHPLAVANILTDLGMDADTIISGLLHDTIEDTGVTKEELEEKFGPKRPGEQVTSSLNYSKAKEILGWQPEVNFDQGVKKVVAWYKERTNEQK